MAGGLIGRDAELAELAHAFDQARGGEGQLVLVTGEPGIGKTALVEETAAAAAAADVRACWGRCWEGGGGAPFWPWVQVLRSALGEYGGEEQAGLIGSVADDVAALVPDLGGALAGRPGPSSPVTAGLAGRLRLFGSVATALGAVARNEGALVLVLEDVHAADEASLQLLRFLARNVSELPLLALVTFREAELVSSPDRRAALAAAARHGRTLSLTGLDEAAVESLLARTGAAVGSAASAVHAATEGNPFLVLESARLLVAGADPAGLVLPSESHAIVSKRVDALAEPVRRTLRLAALLGREFELATLARLAGDPPDDLLDHLAEGCDAFVLSEIGLGRWAFAHALLREALLAELDGQGVRATQAGHGVGATQAGQGVQATQAGHGVEATQAGWHRRAAEALSWRHADDPLVAGQIAHHLVAAGDPGAIDACARAAQVAMDQFAYEQAGGWWEQAIELLSGDERRRYELLLAVTEARLRQGSVTAAKEASARAFKAARACGSVELLAQAAVRIAPYAVSDPVVITAVDDALCELPEADSLLRAEAMVAFARVMGGSSISRGMLQQVNNEGLAMARRVAEGEALWPLLWQWHQNAFRDLNSLQDRLPVAAELLRMAAASGDGERIVLARLWHSSNLFELGESTAATEQAQLALEQAEGLRQPFLVWSTLALQVRIALLRGEFDRAETFARRAREVGGALDEAGDTERGAAGSLTDTLATRTTRAPIADGGITNAEYEFDAAMWSIRRNLGRFEDLIEQGRATLRRWPVYGLDCTRQVGVAFALAELGRHDEARRELDALLAEGVRECLFGICTPVGFVDAPRLCCPAAVADVCWVLGAADLALHLYDLLQPYADRHVIVGEGESRGLCARYLGQLATLLERYPAAEAHFRAAHLFHDRIGAPALGAFGRRDHARMLLRRDGPGDRGLAQELFTAARDTFRALGMDVYGERSQAELDAMGRGLSLRQEGEYWAVALGGAEARVRDSKGLRYLARLVENPGRELHALDLAGDGGVEQPVSADAGAVLDASAKAAYRRRLGDATAASDEVAFLEAELTGAVGLGGRDRRAASDAERARQAVTRAIRAAIERVAEAHPGLGKHLRSSVRTGTFSAYEPSD